MKLDMGSKGSEMEFEAKEPCEGFRANFELFAKRKINFLAIPHKCSFKIYIAATSPYLRIALCARQMGINSTYNEK